MNQLKLFTLETPLGTLRGAVGPKGLVALTMRQDDGQYLEKLLKKRAPGAGRKQVAAKSTEPGRRLAAYFKDPQASLEVPLDLEGLTPFTQAVLLALLDIPPGQTLTYGQVAKIVGRPKAPRAVGQALHNNPLPLFLACHRVIGADGSLTGFGSGLPNKKALLAWENGENPWK
ncbi:MAG: methylated-DNA--[protein]-cysteine S-methyltransferase [Desulfarculaceae bacterium]|nr:methylated-DNA--[protein]-cysteine S-methyltransferase [Desulfarculaceae bacterium]MCF8049356.1 methylated-DNA--[protein]-cysteine S-methyltransferase [Desulfarculaceae bacterium]MCF8066309.1 methylated-DNA--[protein]-cysteine S-methyltransferase [Desulfarculaceae bacterium]MCF8099353.1 methylated-DNA--[protein]-cysteine S-methyltransferase [Desulfarculaceae bacterium]MCF8123396.1 methylated-DNA--[protein]-cysteine S-methyltransferase [Desulfarculaceae bacterium]